ncbi:AI-2E family transporter [Fuerstiella marisgermanici]|uniref:Transport of quorum-sensing signal protein n=1 Tax=Fuerstiella marisgermanici TaxID=1891926 RepID=A0A1P8WJC3_9PLAN|nr:AI-2E family transporter [Fuerstiella marisgermanici]APZ94166.1 Transport of quorum-sensing signal protein [Fuerstiella marisgermanici]
MIITPESSSESFRQIVEADHAGADSGAAKLRRRRRDRMEMIRTTSVVVIAFLLMTQAFYVAAAVMIPVISAVVISLALRPIVRKLSSYGLPDAVAAFITLGLLTGVTVLLASRLITPASEWMSRTPIKFKLRQLEQKLEPLREPLESVQEASHEISKAVDKSTATPSDELSAPEAVVIKPPNLVSAMLSSTWQLAAGSLLCIVLTFFFLAKGEALLEHIAVVLPFEASGTSCESGVAAVERSISRYLLTVSVINACLGASVAAACWLVGVPNALLWGAMATLLNFLPYIGGLVGAGVVLLVSLFTFDSIAYASLAPLAYVTLTAIEGNFVTPSVLGRSMSLNPLVVILSLTYWTWLWGAAGAVLAVPLLAIFVSACRQFNGTRPLAAMLSD